MTPKCRTARICCGLSDVLFMIFSFVVRFIVHDPERPVDLFEDNDPAELMGKGIVRNLPSFIRTADELVAESQGSSDHKVNPALTSCLQ